MQIAYRVAEAIRTHSDELARVGHMKRAGHPPRLMTARLRDRDRTDIGDPRDREETHAVALERRTERQPEGDHRLQAKRIQMMVPARHEPRTKVDADRFVLRQPRECATPYDPRSVPRQEAASYEDRLDGVRPFVTS